MRRHQDVRPREASDRKIGAALRAVVEELECLSSLTLFYKLILEPISAVSGPTATILG
jgi:hypothetical protein